MQYIPVDTIIKQIIFDEKQKLTSDISEDFMHSFSGEKDNVFYWQINKEGKIYYSENLDNFIKSKISAGEEYYFIKEYNDGLINLLKAIQGSSKAVFYSLPIYKIKSVYVPAFVLNMEGKYSTIRRQYHGAFEIIPVYISETSRQENTEVYAHEIKNILTGILSLAGKIKSKAITTKIKRYADEIKKAVQNTNYMISMMKGEDNKTQCEKVNLHSVINDTAAMFANEKKIKFKMNLAAGNPLIIGNEIMLGNAIYNLIINGIQAQKFKGRIEIETYNKKIPFGAVVKHKEYVVIEIKDRGYGIRLENTGKIFEKGFTSKKNGQGIGLYSLSETVKEHEGSVKVSSSKSGGTIFSIILPCKVD